MKPLDFTILSNDEGKVKIAQIYEKHYGLMMYVAKRILKDYALAEDAVLESLGKILCVSEKVGEVSCNKTKSLIVIIVEWASLNILQKQKSINFDTEEEIEKAVDPSVSVADEVISVESYTELVEIIDTLHPILKDIAVLALLHDMSHAQIEEVLGISYASARMRLSRAKDILRNKLARGDNHGKQ